MPMQMRMFAEVVYRWASNKQNKTETLDEAILKIMIKVELSCKGIAKPFHSDMMDRDHNKN
jgi:hypothetical protein